MFSYNYLELEIIAIDADSYDTEMLETRGLNPLFLS